MIKGIGIDLIELKRIQNSMEKNKRFVERILTQKEKEVFISLQNSRRKVEFLAGRFAAKEAFAKATGSGIGKLSFQHIEVLPNEQGAPLVQVQGYEAYNIFISIAHSREYATAQVIIEEK
ncbi:holo-ACP synthase [Virgibacillus sp. C22-A2]|uniref:Holo-[acyl-carrier-protein] synthase n=1 Tax=Virgibacillus tibetensis TaxID=3042313 RepID=A0ABU6KHW1_9BACI|nr:holo-ACP synthase [Virgibacillus sp. C22-A2]